MHRPNAAVELLCKTGLLSLEFLELLCHSVNFRLHVVHACLSPQGRLPDSYYVQQIKLTLELWLNLLQHLLRDGLDLFFS